MLEADPRGEKVLRLPDDTLLKLFRQRRRISRELFAPSAKRFARNALKLELLGIRCPQVLAIYWLREPPCHLIRYKPVPGHSLRQRVPGIDRDAQLALFARLAVFIGYLHNQGVYFRSLHMGNIILTPDQYFGLIDIADMRCLDKPLSARLRARNYYHLLRYTDDWARVDSDVRTLFTFGKP